MDNSPPLRIQAVSRTPVSSKEARKQVDGYLKNLNARTTASQGANTAVTVQLEKLRDALKEERKMASNSLKMFRIIIEIFL